MSKREPIELRFAWQKEDGIHIQSGIYVFDDMTLKEVVNWARELDNSPDWIELNVMLAEVEEH